jgi:sugar/nucleoside kinase (ribokinase family)
MIRDKEVFATATLGAGDTFFESFVAVYLETENAVRAVKIVITKAEQLLKRK